MDLVTYPRLPLSTKIFNFTEYIPRTWWETIRSVFKFNYWFKPSLNPRASSASVLQEWKRETERSACESGSAKLHFQHCLSSNIASVRSFWWNLTMTIVPYARLPTIADVLPWFLFTEIQLRATVRHSFLIAPHTGSRQTEANHILAPTICTPHPPTPRDQKPVCMCVFVRVRVQVWLSTMSRYSHHRGVLRIHNNPSITDITSSTFFSLCLRNIFRWENRFSGRPFLIGLLRLRWAWKVGVAHQGRYFHLMKPKINRTSPSSHI